MNPSRPVLSLQDLEAFDAQAPTGARRRFCCPLCGGDKPRDGAHRCLSVEMASGLWRCFRCEAKGQLREKWQDKPLRHSRRSGEAMRRAFALQAVGQGRAEGAGVSLAAALETQAPTSEAVTDGASDPLRRALRGLHPLVGTAGESYLRGRGLPLDVCLEAKVKFSSSWLGRPAVVFPIYDHQGQLVAAQGRYIDGRTTPKARTVGPKKEGLFLSGGFWDQVRRGAPIVITEAPINSLSLAACGFPSVAVCGKSGWPSWLPVRCAFKEVAVAFDADEAGDAGARQLLPLLDSLGAKVRRLAPEGQGVKDWNEMLQVMGTKELGDWLCLHLL